MGGSSNKARVGLGAVLLFTVPLVAAACDPTCPAFDNPCPERIDIGALCVGDTCTLDGEPTKCIGACHLPKGLVLSILLGDGSPSTNPDLLVETSNGGCSGARIRPTDLAVALDGVPGKPFEYTYDGFSVFVFRWLPPPFPAMTLDVQYAGDEFTDCTDVRLSWVDAECESDHPRYPCAG